MVAPAQPGAAAAASSESPAAELARRSLCALVEAHGLAVGADPWRCEALLRDLCGGSRREIFWLVSALKENILADIKLGASQSATPVLAARLAHKLEEDLGFAAQPAAWTAATWIEAVALAPASAPAPDLAHIVRAPLPEWPDKDDPAGFPEPEPPAPVLPEAVPPGVDVRWLGLCGLGIVAAALALAALAWTAFLPAPTTARAWLTTTGGLAAALALSGLGEFALARGVAAWPPRRRPDLSRSPAALIPELLLLLAQPAVLVLAPIVWFGGWWGAWHYYGPQVTFAFHLGRLVQSLLVAAFLVKWADWMTRVQAGAAHALGRPA